MNRTIQNKMAMYTRVINVLEANRSIWESLNGFTQHVEHFNGNVDRIGGMLKDLMKRSQPITVKKNETLDELSEKALVLRGALKSLSLINKDRSLEKSIPSTRNQISKGSSRNRIHSIQLMLEVAETVQKELEDHGWSMSDQEEALTMVEASINILQSPQELRNTVSRVREIVAKLINESDSILRDGLDALMIGFRSENDEFVIDWEKARTIIDIRGTRRPRKADLEIIDGSIEDRSAEIEISHFENPDAENEPSLSDPPDEERTEEDKNS